LQGFLFDFFAREEGFLALNALIWRLFQRLIEEFNLAVDSVSGVSYHAPRSQVL
jgi:hypothetical protein